MAASQANRKLRAIFSADVKGYSLLMADNELATIDTLKAHKETMAAVIQEHNGRVVDSPGDNLMAEFASAVDAVTSAVKIQDKLKAINLEMPQDRRMKFRIGINIGDIVHEGDRIYGDGVNVASRIESLADPGGVCISRGIFDQIKQKLELGFQYLGEHAVKNISEPVRVYRILMHPERAGEVIGEKQFLGKISQRVAIVALLIMAIIVGGAISYYIYLRQEGRIEPASVERMAYPLPEKPSIAVLPFDNMSDDPKQEYLSDGISEEIINALSKTDQLFVTARNSTFTYKGKAVKVKQVAEELGVRYVLEGSIRKSEDRVRITAQLIDATTGHHLWSERYDRELKDVFDLQDEVTLKIVTALQINLTEGEQARIFEEKGESLDFKLKQMELMSLWRKGTTESFTRFGQLSQETIDMAPESPIGYRALAAYHWYLVVYAALSKSTRESFKKAFEFAQKAISLDDSDAGSRAILGSIYLMMRQYDKAIEEGERSIAIVPNGAGLHGGFGITLSYADRVNEGINHLKQAIRLNPFPPYWYYFHLSRCYRLNGQYDEALIEVNKAIQRAPNDLGSNFLLAVLYVQMGQIEKAEAAAQKVLELRPDYSVEAASKTWPYKNPNEIKIIIDAASKAGLK